MKALCKRWFPVLWLQVKAHRLARAAAERGAPLPADYHRAMGW